MCIMLSSRNPLFALFWRVVGLLTEEEDGSCQTRPTIKRNVRLRCLFVSPKYACFVDEGGADRRDCLRKQGYSVRGRPIMSPKLTFCGERVSAIMGMSSTESLDYVDLGKTRLKLMSSSSLWLTYSHTWCPSMELTQMASWFLATVLSTMWTELGSYFRNMEIWYTSYHHIHQTIIQLRRLFQRLCVLLATWRMHYIVALWTHAWQQPLQTSPVVIVKHGLVNVGYITP